MYSETLAQSEWRDTAECRQKINKNKKANEKQCRTQIQSAPSCLWVGSSTSQLPPPHWGDLGRGCEVDGTPSCIIWTALSHRPKWWHIQEAQLISWSGCSHAAVRSCRPAVKVRRCPVLYGPGLGWWRRTLPSYQSRSSSSPSSSFVFYCISTFFLHCATYDSAVSAV